MATIVCAFAGYSFSKFRYRGRKFIMGLFMMSQAFPQAILLLSIYVLMQRTGLLGSYWALLISYVVFTLPVGTWTLKSYFDQLPDALIESAKIDGAGHARIMFQIIFPMAVPGMISIAIYGFAWSRNDLLYSMTLGHRHRPPHPGARSGDDLPGRGVHQLERHDGRFAGVRRAGDHHLRLFAALLHPGPHLRRGEGMNLPEAKKSGIPVDAALLLFLRFRTAAGQPHTWRGAAVGEPDHTLQPLGKGALSGGGQGAVVHDDGVELIARLETAHLAEELAAALGGKIERLGQGEGGKAVVHQAPAQLGALDGVGHGAEDGKMRAAGHVAAQARLLALVQPGAHRGDAGGHIRWTGGQCARNTPCSFIRARSSSPLQMQWAITVGHSPPKRPGRL